VILRPTLTSGLTRRKPLRDINFAYWLGSQRLYSLSRVLRDLGLKPDFTDVNPEVLLKAQQRGKLTEQYCFDLIQGKSVVVRSKHCGSLQEAVALRVEAFNRWKERFEPVYVDHHQIVFSEVDGVAWEEDLKVMLRGELTLVDIKATSGTANDWQIQLGCGLEYDPDVKRAAILHLNPRLNKDGFRWREVDPKHARSQYRRAVNHWLSRRDFSLLRNELGYESEAESLC
jgi:hypothetical protein